MKRVKLGRFAPLSRAGQEAINTLCTNLSFSGEQMKIIMVDSVHPSEGKSFLMMNMMRTLAKYGKRVVVVDADLRQSTVTADFRLQFEDAENRKGLAHWLADLCEQEDVIYETDIPGAYMVPRGTAASNPLPLLHSSRLKALLDGLKTQADYVLIGAPAVDGVIDAAEIAKSCDGALLVVGYNAVRRQELIDARDQILQSGCAIIGTVLNQVDLNDFVSRKFFHRALSSRYDRKQKKRNGAHRSFLVCNSGKYRPRSPKEEICSTWPEMPPAACRFL